MTTPQAPCPTCAELRGEREALREALEYTLKHALTFNCDMRGHSTVRRALVNPEASGQRSELSRQIDEALEKSKPLVREALKIGRSIAGPDPTLAGVVIGSGQRACATCGGKLVDMPTVCIDCSAGRAGVGR